MYKVTNPTDKALEIQYRGLRYRVEAEDSIELSEEIALHWKTIHAFLLVEQTNSNSTKVETNVVPEETAGEVKGPEEVKEEIEAKEEVLDKKPAPKKAAKR